MNCIITIVSLFLLGLLIQNGDCQTFTMLSTYPLAKLGDTVVLTAKSSVAVQRSQVNWYFKDTAITVNGQLAFANGKYGITYNGTLFALSIIEVTPEDYGQYTLLYLNLPTIVILNVTLNELTTIEGIFEVAKKCRNENAAIASCVLLIAGLLMLVITAAILYLLNRSYDQEKKMEKINTFVLVVTVQGSTAFLSATITLWTSFYKFLDNRNTSASILGLVSYLIIWFGIYFFASAHARYNKFYMIYGYGLMLLTFTQIGMIVGVIVCVSYCANVVILPTLDVDYGLLGVLFAAITLTISFFVLVFSFLYYKSKHFRRLVISICTNAKFIDSEAMDSNRQNEMLVEEQLDEQTTSETTGKDKKKKSLKAKLKSKFKSLKGNNKVDEKPSTNGTTTKPDAKAVKPPTPTSPVNAAALPMSSNEMQRSSDATLTPMTPAPSPVPNLTLTDPNNLNRLL